MRTAGFVDHDQPPERPARRRDLAGLAAIALLCAGAGLTLAAALQAPGAPLPKPGPRRYGPAYRHHEAG